MRLLQLYSQVSYRQSGTHFLFDVTLSTTVQLTLKFRSSFSCWNLLQQTEELRMEFAKLCVNLQTEKWTWLPTFFIDGYLYSAGIHAEAIEKLKSIQNTVNPLPFLIKSAGLYFSIGNYGVRILSKGILASFNLKGFDIFYRQPLSKY